jgi:hypothetical protein
MKIRMLPGIARADHPGVLLLEKTFFDCHS